MGLTVTDKIKEILRQRDAEIVSGQQAIEEILLEVKRQVVAELSVVPADTFASWSLQQSLSAIDGHIRTFQFGFEKELTGRLSNMWDAGQSLLPQAAAAAGMQLNTYWLATDILDSLKDYAFTKVRGLTAEAMTRLRGELTLGLLGSKTPQQIAGDLAAVLPKKLPRSAFGHPIFKSVAERAEVITGLEMGRVFSMATDKSIAAAQESVPDLRRMWLHAGHPSAPRKAHLLMHGQVRKVGTPFFKSAAGGVPVMYPRAPDAPISEVIRCGCTHIPYHPKWGDAKEFAAAFDQNQQKANTRKGA